MKYIYAIIILFLSAARLLGQNIVKCDLEKQKLEQLVNEGDQDKALANKNIFNDYGRCWLAKKENLELKDTYEISDEFLKNDPGLIYLILTTKSIEKPTDRQSWFTLYPSMDDAQISRFWEILIKEKVKLQIIENTYEEKKREIKERLTEKIENIKNGSIEDLRLYPLVLIANYEENKEIPNSIYLGLKYKNGELGIIDKEQPTESKNLATYIFNENTFQDFKADSPEREKILDYLLMVFDAEYKNYTLFKTDKEKFYIKHCFNSYAEFLNDNFMYIEYFQLLQNVKPYNWELSEEQLICAINVMGINYFNADNKYHIEQYFDQTLKNSLFSFPEYSRRLRFLLEYGENGKNFATLSNKGIINNSNISEKIKNLYADPIEFDFLSREYKNSDLINFTYKLLKSVVKQDKGIYTFDENIFREDSQKWCYFLSDSYFNGKFPTITKYSDLIKQAKDETLKYLSAQNASYRNNASFEYMIYYLMYDFSKSKKLTVSERKKLIEEIEKNLLIKVDGNPLYRYTEMTYFQYIKSKTFETKLKNKNFKDLAIFFAIDKYDDPIFPKLNNPIFDATSLANVLVNKFDFDTLIIRNATYDDIFNTLANLSKLEFDDLDQILFFFAGHGTMFNKSGYLVTRDSKGTSPRNYYDFASLISQTNKIRCKHMFTILDVCFSGNFFDVNLNRSGPTVPEIPKDELGVLERETYIGNSISKKALTSGGETPVPDGKPGEHSPFAKLIIEKLNSTKKGTVLTHQGLFSAVEIVSKNKNKPIPQMGYFADETPNSRFIFHAVK